MTKMEINGLGLVGGFGCGKSALLKALADGRVTVEQVALRDRQLPLYQADTAPLDTYLNKRALRRIDHFSRMALLGAFQALEDAGQPDIDRARLGVVVGSGFGPLATTFKFLDTVLDDGDAFASPTAFSNSVHNAAAAHIAMQLKITGPSLTVSQFDQSLVSSLLTARQWLAEGRVDAVLLGVVDEYHPVLGYCWEHYLGTAAATAMNPLDFTRTTAVAGEGAAFFLLQGQSSGAGRYGSIVALEMGSAERGRPQSGAGPQILNCDGIPASGRLYRDHLNGTQAIACYTPLYGASPVSPAFDLAVGALSLERGRLFPSTAPAVADGLGALVTDDAACSALDCLRFGPDGAYGRVGLAQGG